MSHQDHINQLDQEIAELNLSIDNETSAYNKSVLSHEIVSLEKMQAYYINLLNPSKPLNILWVELTPYLDFRK